MKKVEDRKSIMEKWNRVWKESNEFYLKLYDRVFPLNWDMMWREITNLLNCEITATKMEMGDWVHDKILKAMCSDIPEYRKKEIQKILRKLKDEVDVYFGL